MTKTLHDVASTLYDVEHSVSCKICVKCKINKGNEHLSCLDCIEDGLKVLIDKLTTKKPIINPKPYAFKDLHEGMWVWDYKLKWLYQIFDAHEEDKSIEVVVSDRNAIFRKVVTLDKFEENRFYPVQKANQGE